MRTTVILDSDVSAQLPLAMQRNRASFKEALNNAVCVGVSVLPKEVAKKRKPYVVKTRDLGMRTDLLPSRVLAALDEEADLAKRLR